MTNLSQHGGFDEDLLSQVKDALTLEFTEGEHDSFEFAQLCQRADGSIYGTQGQCRKGSPISVKPGEGMPDIARKAKARGLKQKDVKSVADAVREKYGAKVVKKGAPLESAARRLGERLKPKDEDQQQKPKDRSLKDLGTRSLEKEQLMAGSRGLRARREMVRRVLGEAPKPIAPAPAPVPAPKPKGEGTKAVEKKIREMQKGLARVRKLKDEAGDPAAKKLYGSVERAMQRDIKKMAQAGDTTKAKAAAAARPVAAPSSKPRVGVGPKADVVRRAEGNIHDVLLNGQRVGQMVKLPGDPRYQIDVGGQQERVQGLAMARARARRMAQDMAAGQAKAAAPKAPAAPKQKRMAVGKKLLQGARTSELMRILKEESLNAFQRKKIEDELRNRGMSSSAIPKKPGVAPKAAKAGKANFDIPQGVKGYDPKADMAGPGKLLGQGAMGRVKLTEGPPPGVTKQGKIGEFEAAAIKRLEGSGVTPTLHGATVSGQAKRVSSGLGGHVKEASGYLGMSRMAGEPYGDQRWQMSQAEKSKAVDEYLRVRKAIHTRGVAHNDMHAGNFFYDKTTGKGGLVDFGLAQISPKAALIEALGTTNGRDWQADRMQVGNYNTRAVQRFVANSQRVRDKMDRDFGVRINAEIRSPMDRIESMFGRMSDRDAENLINELYDGI